MNEIPLRACPFCGGNVLEKYLDGNNPGNDYWIHCNRCGASCGMQESKYEAIEAWNTRQESKLTLNREKLSKQIFMCFAMQQEYVEEREIHWKLMDNEDKAIWLHKADAIKAKETELWERKE